MSPATYSPYEEFTEMLVMLEAGSPSTFVNKHTMSGW
jgi:hypothetical protein